MNKQRSKRDVIEAPTEEEDAAINLGIAKDPDNPELGEDFFKSAVPTRELPAQVQTVIKGVRGRPKKAPGEAKVRFNGLIDPDIDRALRERAKAEGVKHTTLANDLLRHVLLND